MIADLDKSTTRLALTEEQAEQIHRAVNVTLRERRLYVLEGEEVNGSRRAVSVLRWILDHVEALSGAEIREVLDLEPGDAYPFCLSGERVVTLRRVA